MTQQIISCFQALSSNGSVPCAIEGNTFLCLEALAHTYAYCMSEAHFRTQRWQLSHRISFFKTAQSLHPIVVTYLFCISAPLAVKNLIFFTGAMLVASDLYQRSFMTPRTPKNQLRHRLICGVGHAFNITVKTANIVATCALLRNYSQTAMVAGGVAMAILSGMNLWFDWQQISRLRGDSVPA